MTLYAYRLVVERWPTDDGQPWARYYGEDAPVPFDELPAWLAELVSAATPFQYRNRSQHPLARVADRVKLDDADEVHGVLMPKVHRRHYLSGSGAHELAQDMRAFGAVVTIQRSAPVVEWHDVDHAEAQQAERRQAPGGMGVRGD